MLKKWFEKQNTSEFSSPFMEDGFFSLPENIMARPSVVIGEGGSGKTETLLKMAHLAATAYGFDVIFLDAKGDDDLAPRFVATMCHAGKQHIKLFPVSPYYGWAGNTRALFNRLMAVQTYSEPYYEQMANMMLDLALKAPGGPPRSSTELLRSLLLDQLRVSYRGLPEQEELTHIKPEDASGVYNRYRAFFTSLDGKLDTGFTFDETDAAYIKLDTVAFAKECSSIGRYLVEDIAHYVTVRKPRNKKVLIIIDEVSALAIEHIADLAERLRSFRGAMMLASQSEEGLAKTLDERNRILKTAHMLVLHTCNTPERLIERAGKYKKVETGWSVRDQEATGHSTMRLTDEYIIAPDEARRLDVGECFVIAKGYGYKVRIAPVQGSTAALQDAQTFLAQEAASSAAPQAATPPASSKQNPTNGTQRNDDQQSQSGKPHLL